MKELETEVNWFKSQAFASGTLRNLTLQWKAFISFCLYYDLPFLPTSQLTISCYIAFLARTFKSADSIRNYINAVKNVHLTSGLTFEFHSSFETNIIFKGLKRVKLHQTKQALPITPVILNQFLQFLNLNDANDISYWAAFLLAFYLMARKSNIVPPAVKSFDSKKHLCRGDILFNEDGLIILLKWSKTNQFGERKLSVPLVSMKDSPLCPVEAIKNLVNNIPAGPEKPAFLLNVKGKFVTMTHRLFTKKLRDLLKLCNYIPEAYSGHSFRRGGASWAFRAGVPAELIKLHGDWASDAYLKYLNFSMQTKCSVSQLMCNLSECYLKNGFE